MKTEIILKQFYFTCNHGITYKLWTLELYSLKISYLLFKIDCFSIFVGSKWCNNFCHECWLLQLTQLWQAVCIYVRLTLAVAFSVGIVKVTGLTVKPLPISVVTTKWPHFPSCCRVGLECLAAWSL